MEKSKSYTNAYFPADVLKNVFEQNLGKGLSKSSFRLRKENETWEYDDEREFFADYRKPHDNSTIRKTVAKTGISVSYTKDVATVVTVQWESRGEIENIFEIFEERYPTAVVPSANVDRNPAIFIGHGRSPAWRDLKDHLTDKHDYKIEAYETGARAGHTIRDILDEMATKSSFAILVMTGEDEGPDGLIRARPNVIHEIGLFQGRLGFSRAIVLLEQGTEEFSNLFGIQQLRFSKGNIKEVFGDVLATLKREFKLNQ